MRVSHVCLHLMELYLKYYVPATTFTSDFGGMYRSLSTPPRRRPSQPARPGALGRPTGHLELVPQERGAAEHVVIQHRSGCRDLVEQRGDGRDKAHVGDAVRCPQACAVRGEAFGLAGTSYPEGGEGAADLVTEAAERIR